MGRLMYVQRRLLVAAGVATGTLGLGPFSPAAQAESTDVVARIDAAETGMPISPYLYGQFIEHIGELMYDVLWSEMLDDRKFYYPVSPETTEEPATEPGRRRRRGIAPGCWNPVGPADAIVMDTQNPFVGDHSPKVLLSGTELHGIRQAGLDFTKGVTYEGHIQLAGDPGVDVSINVVHPDGIRQIVSEVVPAEGFARYDFVFTADHSGSGAFEITGTGEGAFLVGAVSLMPADNIEGFRPDSIAALKSMRSGVYRFPGGNFVSAHDWRDAIGERDRRAPKLDLHWNAVQSNDIGTDEFMILCRLLEVDPYITVNAGFDSARSAADYVEYANGDVSTPMGALRAANGHPEPYGVTYWGIGNEMWGDYQYGYMPLPQYADKHNLFAKAMRSVDPSIVLLASGAMPDTMTGAKQSLVLGDDLVPAYLSDADWTGYLLTHCFDYFDLISEHFYNYGRTHFSLAEAKQVPNDPNEPVTDWMRRAANHIRIKVEAYRAYEELLPRLAAEPKPMAVSEWAYRGGPYPSYPALAWAFHEMFRYPELFRMANYTFGTSMVSMEDGRYRLNSIGKLFKFYRDHYGTIPVGVSGNSPQPEPTDPPGGEQPQVNAGSATFPLDVVAAWTADRRTLTVAVINPTDEEQALNLQIRGVDLAGRGVLHRMTPAGPDDRDTVIQEQALDRVPVHPVLPPFSVNIYELPIKNNQ